MTTFEVWHADDRYPVATITNARVFVGNGYINFTTDDENDPCSEYTFPLVGFYFKTLKEV